MSQQSTTNIPDAVLRIPCGLFILTAGHDGARGGVLTRWVQPCSTAPPLVTVALAKGLPVEPIIRDARAFALCQVAAGDRFLTRMFATPQGRAEDPFVLLSTRCTGSSAPIIDRALSFLDCRIVRHVDLDTDHRLYVGQVVHAEILNGDDGPAVEVGGVTPNGTVNGAPNGNGNGNGTNGAQRN
ncbi:MAG: flavin reductase family protein [Planctomycetota bacterium]|jgi:flavin reductase (DIM6/NTAB) family NADH-FMN oxidoreductase RutF